MNNKHASLACAARLLTLCVRRRHPRAPYLFQSTNDVCVDKDVCLIVSMCFLTEDIPGLATLMSALQIV